MSEKITNTGKTLGFEGLSALVGQTVHLEFNKNPEFHTDIVLSMLKEPDLSQCEKGIVAILPDRQDWPIVIYESTLITSGTDTN